LIDFWKTEPGEAVNGTFRNRLTYHHNYVK